MANQNILRFRKGDCLAVAAVLLLAVLTLLLYLPKNSGAPAVAEVYWDGELVQTLPLDRDGVYLAGNTVVTVSGGRVAVTDSDCPDKDCVRTGAVQTSGRSIVCLPNALEVRVVNAVSDVDFVVG